jgi:hypothetical protein
LTWQLYPSYKVRIGCTGTPTLFFLKSTSCRLFIDLLKLGRQSADAAKLRNFRAPASASAASGEAGDFAAVLYSVVKDRAYDGEKVSVEDLNARFGSFDVFREFGSFLPNLPGTM